VVACLPIDRGHELFFFPLFLLWDRGDANGKPLFVWEWGTLRAILDVGRYVGDDGEWMLDTGSGIR